MRRRAILMMAEGERPHPGRANGRGVHLNDAPDDSAIGEGVEIVIVPLAGWTRGGGAFEDQRRAYDHPPRPLVHGQACSQASASSCDALKVRVSGFAVFQ